MEVSVAVEIVKRVVDLGLQPPRFLLLLLGTLGVGAVTTSVTVETLVAECSPTVSNTSSHDVMVSYSVNVVVLGSMVTSV